MATFSGSASVVVTGVNVGSLNLSDATDGAYNISGSSAVSVAPVNSGDQMFLSIFGTTGNLLGNVHCVAGFTGSQATQVFQAPPGGRTTFTFIPD